MQSQPHGQGPYRLVVRTSRCGRDNPGSTPGEDMYAVSHGKALCCMDAEQLNITRAFHCGMDAELLVPGMLRVRAEVVTSA